MILRAALALGGLALLAGCLAAPPADDPSLLRNPTVPLSIISRGGAEVMHGDWTVRAASPAYRDVRRLTFTTRATPQHRIAIEEVSCDTAGQCEALRDGWLAEPVAQNRWRLRSETTDTELELWVIWIDDGYRTVAIGSPDSDMAFILDRNSKGGADRIQAASEVLEFNGYNMAAFETRL